MIIVTLKVVTVQGDFPKVLSNCFLLLGSVEGDSRVTLMLTFRATLHILSKIKLTDLWQSTVSNYTNILSLKTLYTIR